MHPLFLGFKTNFMKKIAQKKGQYVVILVLFSEIDMNSFRIKKIML